MSLATPRTFDDYQDRRWIPELDGLRAVSVLLVITVHMHDRVWNWLHGQLGVTMFFVLSGYLITMLALREEAARGRVSLRAFYTRRALRLFPLYYFTLGIYCLLILGLGARGDAGGPLLGALPSYLFYFQEYFFLTGAEPAPPFEHSWSLGIEEKFYLLWPPLLFVLLPPGRKMRVTVTVGLACVLALAGLRTGWLPGRFLYHYSHILVGCLLALLMEQRQWYERLRVLGRPAVAALVVAGFVVLHFLCPHSGLPGQSIHTQYIAYKYVYSLAAALLLVTLVAGRGPLHRALSWAPLVHIGRLSYAIYLTHRLCLNVAERIAPPGSGNMAVSLAALLLAILISIAFSQLLHLAIERPCIAWGQRLSQRFKGEALRPPRLAALPAGET